MSDRYDSSGTSLKVDRATRKRAVSSPVHSTTNQPHSLVGNSSNITRRRVVEICYDVIAELHTQSFLYDFHVKYLLRFVRQPVRVKLEEDSFIHTIPALHDSDRHALRGGAGSSAASPSHSPMRSSPLSSSPSRTRARSSPSRARSESRAAPLFVNYPPRDLVYTITALALEYPRVTPHYANHTLSSFDVDIPFNARVPVTAPSVNIGNRATANEAYSSPVSSSELFQYVCDHPAMFGVESMSSRGVCPAIRFQLHLPLWDLANTIRAHTRIGDDENNLSLSERYSMLMFLLPGQKDRMTPVSTPSSSPSMSVSDGGASVSTPHIRFRVFLLSHLAEEAQEGREATTQPSESASFSPKKVAKDANYCPLPVENYVTRALRQSAEQFVPFMIQKAFIMFKRYRSRECAFITHFQG